MTWTSKTQMTSNKIRDSKMHTLTNVRMKDSYKILMTTRTSKMHVLNLVNKSQTTTTTFEDHLLLLLVIAKLFSEQATM